jgi:hypothetical protein
MRRLLVVAALLAATHAGAMTLGEYAGALDHLRGLVESNQLDAARAEAKALIGQDVDGKFVTDRSLLEEVAALKRADVHLRERLLTTATELRRSSGMAVPPGDIALLDRIHQQQTTASATPGGEVISPRLQNMSLLERIAEMTGKALRWIGEKLQAFFDWLAGFMPKRRSSGDTPTSGMRWLVITVVALIAVLIVVLAVEVIRRSRKRVDFDAIESEPISSRRDDDPLSRGATEWERYAAQLAAAGRVREAIRAWYHAVLVTLYAAGILSFRKGRTNWEYVSALAPALRWRGDFVSLTRQFEHQWYGSERSPAEALDDVSRSASAILEAVRRGAG